MINFFSFRFYEIIKSRKLEKIESFQLCNIIRVWKIFKKKCKRIWNQVANAKKIHYPCMILFRFPIILSGRLAAAQYSRTVSHKLYITVLCDVLYNIYIYTCIFIFIIKQLVDRSWWWRRRCWRNVFVHVSRRIRKLKYILNKM